MNKEKKSSIIMNKTKGFSDKSIKLICDNYSNNSNLVISNPLNAKNCATEIIIQNLDQNSRSPSPQKIEPPKIPKVIQKKFIKDFKLNNITETKPAKKNELLENVRKYLKESNIKENN